MYESSLALGLSPYTAGEQPKNQRLIKLNTNENPFPPSPRVAEALAGVCDSLRLYPDMEATAVREAIAEREGLSADQVFCGNGSDEVLAFAFAALFAGKTLYAPDITYSFYPVYSQLFGVRYQTVPLREDFTVDVDALLAHAPVALANPNAPTGIFLPIAEVERLAERCRAAGEALLVDEAYAAFAPDCARRLLDRYDNLLIVRTLSKSHGLAGLRLGYALGSRRLIDALRRVRDSFNSYPTDRLAQAAGAAAVRDAAYTADCVERICAARDWTADQLRQAGFQVLPSATNFLFVRAAEADAGPVQRALREEGILVRHFTAPRLKPWLRISVGTMADMQAVTEALIRLAPPA